MFHVLLGGSLAIMFASKRCAKLSVGVFFVGLLAGFVHLFFRGKRDRCLSQLVINKKKYQHCLQKERESPHKFCYVSLLCDDVMIDAALTLLYSFKKTESSFPFLMLVLPEVTQRTALQTLGAQLIDIPLLEYPKMFRQTKEKQKINKMCRYSKLHIWKLTEFQKAIFVDIDTIFRKNTDEVFTHPAISAVSDLGDTFNTGFFVLKPCLHTYRKMLESYTQADSYNQSDQGFINTFFQGKQTTRLPVEYNTMCKAKEFAQWHLLRENAKLFHYTSETKPWNFFYTPHKHFRENFDIEFYYEWIALFYETQRELRRGVFCDGGPIWSDIERRKNVCAKAIPEASLLLKKATADWFTVVLFKWATPGSLDLALQHLRLCAPHLIARIVVPVPSDTILPELLVQKYSLLSQKADLPPVIFRFVPSRSQNSLLDPGPEFETKAVFYTSDSFLPDGEWLELSFFTWKQNKKALVGAFPHYHFKKEGEENLRKDKTRLEEVTILYTVFNHKTPHPYSLLSLHGLFVSLEYLYIYTCLLPLEIHQLVDRCNETPELPLNLFVSAMAEQRPFMVAQHGMPKSPDPRGTGRETPGDYQGIETYLVGKRYNGQYASAPDLNFHQRRARMLRELLYMFDGRDPLYFNNFSVTQFQKIPFRKKSPKQWHQR